MSLIKTEDGIAGQNKDCFSKNAKKIDLDEERISKLKYYCLNRNHVFFINQLILLSINWSTNCWKSTLPRSITRKRLKIASYPFTTLKPHLRMIFYDDNEQIAVADLPGFIEDSHKNRGLGITFFEPAERCAFLF
ncbi:hypothetical protein HCN44_001800 [Aphidius gifuensis]|uniref:OBG-type G domain-containing protein n=1 Tax=Aphidius gifuensis TaxID=684658 RepID=A0A835CSE0_APHGI|nr:hypothetical protein HCN44_001800 [Aphidius gifuensis]